MADPKISGVADIIFYSLPTFVVEAQIPDFARLPLRGVQHVCLVGSPCVDVYDGCD